MDDTNEYKIVEKEDFLLEFAKLKPVVTGSGKIIAREAGLAYHTYRNALSGKVSNPAILGAILRACKVVHQEIIDKYSE